MISGAPVRIAEPAVLPVTLAELKAQCRYFESDEDAIMTAMLKSATEEVENYAGLGLIDQTWQQEFSGFGDMVLYRKPVQAVLSVGYSESAGSPGGIDPATYEVSGLGNPRSVARIGLGANQLWPTVGTTAPLVTVTYTVGFGPDWNSVPELIRLAILYAAATRFGYREDLIMGSTVSELPMTSKTMLRDYRPLAVA